MIPFRRKASPASASSASSTSKEAAAKKKNCVDDGLAIDNNNVADAAVASEDARSKELAGSARKMVINVGGTKFRVHVANFARMAPGSRLSR